MATVIAVANQKGGVGKTTTTVNLAAALAVAGQRVLVVDLDPQANAGLCFGLDVEDLPRGTIYDVLMGAERALASIIVSTEDGVDLAPSNIDLAGAEVQLVSRMAREAALSKKLESQRLAYDIILIDCPPSLGLLTVNALVAADEVLVPVEARYLAYRGTQQLLATVATVKEELNRRLQIRGLLLTRFDGRTVHAGEVAAMLRQKYGARLLDVTIKERVELADAGLAGKSIFRHAPTSPSAAAYRELAERVLARA
ncbi:MAG: ParA family protein [Chloroflexota bacterium]